MPLRDVVVLLSGMIEGKKAVEKYTVPDSEQDSTFNFLLLIPDQGLTDYQLSLLWGQEARLFLEEAGKSSPDWLEVKEAQLVEEQSTDCDSPSCPPAYYVEAELFNRGARAIDEAVLALNFCPLNQEGFVDFSACSTDNEELVRLESLHLPTGAKRQIKLSIESAVPPDGHLHFRPILGVMEIKTE